MVDVERLRVWVARLAAPAAFFAAALVLFLLVQSAISSSSPEEPAASRAAQTGGSVTEPDETTTTQGKTKKRFYRVRPGDTLESIAERRDTSVDTLLLLNPEIDPLELSPGQRIRVA